MKNIERLLVVGTVLLALSGEGAQPCATLLDGTRTALANTAKADGKVRLNFRGAPLETVMEYLSEAAGFTIVLEAEPKGTVDVWSDQALSREEALNLLDSALIKNGFAAIRDGRTLTIVNRDEAKTRYIPVKLGGDPAGIPGTDEIVTQIIPVRFTEVSQLLKDLQPLLSTRTTLTANDSANSIVITDTQANIRRIAQLIKAIDAGAEDVTLVKIFRLKNADPTETAELLGELFPDQSQSIQSAIQVGGGPMAGGLGGGPMPGGFGEANSSGASTGQSSQSQRLKKRVTVTAVADQRTASLVVTTSRDLMGQVERVVAQLDASPAGKQKLGVYRLQSAQAQQVVKVLQDLFQKSGTANTRTTSASQTDPLETRSTTQLQAQSQQSSSNSRSGIGGGSSGLGGGGGAGGGGP